MKLTSGILISLEGIDGSGKSLLAQNLYKKFEQNSLPTVLTKEPGGSDLGKLIRKILQEQPVKIKPKAEFLLFAADRAQHFETIIIPALEEKKLVLSDRLADSSIAYQGYGRGVDISMIKTINSWAMNKRQPDLTIYSKIDLETAISRFKKRSDNLSAFEKEKKEFFQKLTDGFDAIFEKRENVLILDGSKDIKIRTEKAYQFILTWFASRNILEK